MPCTSTGDLKCEPDVDTGAISYRISGSGIEAKTELRIRAEVVQTCQSSRRSLRLRPMKQNQSSGTLPLPFAFILQTPGKISGTLRAITAHPWRRCEPKTVISGDVVENRGMLLIPM